VAQPHPPRIVSNRPRGVADVLRASPRGERRPFFCNFSLAAQRKVKEIFDRYAKRFPNCYIPLAASQQTFMRILNAGLLHFLTV